MLPFFSMVDRRKRLHKDTIATLRERFPLILNTEVPYGSEFERIALRRAPIESYAPGSAAADVYRMLWREIDAAARRLAPWRRPAVRSDVEDELDILKVDLGQRGLVAAAHEVAER